MANELDELTGPVNQEGRDVAVIEKQLPIKVGIGSKIFEVLLWVLAIIPGVVFLFMKIKAGNYLSQLQQKLQHDASQIDNYLEQRVVILQNCARLLDKAIDLDKTTMTQIAAYRSGADPSNDGARNEIAKQIDSVGSIFREGACPRSTRSQTSAPFWTSTPPISSACRITYETTRKGVRHGKTKSTPRGAFFCSKMRCALKRTRSSPAP